MTENKRFEMIITGADGSFHYLDKNTGEKITSTLELENKLNALHEERNYFERKKEEFLSKWSIANTENIQLKQENEQLKTKNNAYLQDIEMFKEENTTLKLENEQLKQQKPFLKIHDDYFIQYGDDNELFNLHKPSDIRSLCYLINRENGYDELECEYNEEGYGND